MLIKFLDFESWRLFEAGHLFEAGRLLNFHHFQQVVSLFCNKTINNLTKREDVPNQNFNCSLRVL